MRLIQILACAVLMRAPEAEGQTVLTNIALPSAASGLQLDPGLNRIYVWYGPQANSSVLAIDGATFTKAVWGPGKGPLGVDLATHAVWVPGLYSGRVSVYDSEGSELGYFDLGYCPISTTVDVSNRIVWVAAQCGDRNDPVWAIEADDYRILAGPIGNGGVNGGPMAANPATGRFYQTADGVTWRIDAATFARRAAACGPILGVDAPANLLYAQGRGNILQLVNGAPDPEVILSNVDLPFPPRNSVAVDSARNRLYVPNPEGNTILILNGASGANLGTVTLAPDVTVVQGVAVDSGRNLIYAVAASRAGSSCLCVIQGAGAED